MDVQTINSSGPPAAVDGTLAAAAAVPVAAALTPDFTDGPSIGAAAAGGAAAPASGTPPNVPASAAGNVAPPLPGGVREHSSTLAAVTKSLLGATVTVSYDTISEQGRVLTVFKDAQTGQTLFRLPPEIITQLAGFFDQISGAVVDKKA